MKKRISFYSFIFIVIILDSCRLISFTAEPGSPRNAFPLEMQGEFIATEKHKGGNDSIILYIHEKEAEINDKMLDKLLHLSDSTTLTHLGDYYFYNIRQKDSSRYTWWSFPVLVEKNAIYIHTLSQGKQQKKLEKYLKPSGIASGEYMMDNEPFKNYCEKHLKKRHAIKLKRIK